MESPFDNLSDCVLLDLLEYLDSTTLYQLSQVNTRFEEIVLKKTLWKRIDARDEPNDEKKIDYILDRVHNMTEILLMKGKKVYLSVVGMIQAKTFECLTVLALEHQFISQHVKLANFPKTLVELSFKNSVFDLSSEFFRKSYEAMENLKVLIIDGCRHVSTSTLMSVSKYPSLEIFSCYKCPIENSIAYFSIAVSNGFKKIKVFDVRLSGLGNTFLRAFMKKPNIAVIYFQNCDKSYEMDFRDRVTEATKLNLPVPKVTFNTLISTGTEDSLVTDLGTFDFSRTTATDDKIQLPKSYLYKYPYSPCSCGFKEKQENNELGVDDPPLTRSAIYVRGDERKLVEIISQEHVLSDDDWETEEDMDSETENGDTEIEQFHNTANNAMPGPALGGNSLLDDRSQPRARVDSTQTDQPVRADQPALHAPSTSGLSESPRKRKLSNADDGGKRAKRRSGSASTDEDEGGPSSSQGAGRREQRSDDVVLGDSAQDEITARLMASNELIVSKVPRSESSGRSRSRGRSPNVNRRFRGSRPVPPIPPAEPSRPSPPTRTQIFQCACGAHSVIVVTADEAANGPSVHPLENLFHPHHCEQRINLNERQSLRVINRNEAPNARPEVELVEINKNRSLKSGLRHLSFRGYHRVTNLTLRSIEHLHLDLVDLTYTQCTKQGVLDFLRLNPNCRVLHKDFCVCKPKMDF